MSFQPVLPFGGYGGWAFLTRTLEQQQDSFRDSAPIKRDTEYFRSRIGQIRTAADLVADRRLLSVALGAFGLSEDVDKTAFVRQVLEQGTADPKALANRLSDGRYAQMSRAFGFASGFPNTWMSSFANDIVARYESRSFEVAVGEQDDAMRQALNLEQGLADILDQAKGADARWFAVMGSGALRNVFETALGFPRSFGQIGLDQQLVQFKDRADRVLGTHDLTEIARPEIREKLIQMFLIRTEMEQTALSTGNIALTLLQQ